MREYVDTMFEWAGAREPWRPLPRWAIAAWLAFYASFLAYALRMHGEFLLSIPPT